LKIYDLIIIGAGPAGLTAAIYAARKGMDFLVLSDNIGGQTLWSADIENYIGYQFISGADLVEKFREHVNSYKIQLKDSERVSGVFPGKEYIKVVAHNNEYRSKTAIIATGRIPRKLGVSGEEKYLGRGVSYCATCDGPLFRNRKIAVVGGGNSGLDAVLGLEKNADSIYLIESSAELEADPVVVRKAASSGKVTIYRNANVTEIYGDEFVRGIKVRSKESLLDIGVEGVFVEIGTRPVSEIVESAAKNDKNEIIVDCSCRTNIEGIFAAGDVTDVIAKQIIVACGEGAKAALASFAYLSRKG
jgi:alkyl hydroperoxide reductase subunit F